MNFGTQVFRAVLEALVESFQVEVAESSGDRIRHGLAYRLRLEHVGYGGEESDHHNIEHHALAELFRKASGRYTVDTHAGRQLFYAHQVLLDDEDAVGLQLGGEERVGFLRHGDEDVGAGYIRIEDGFIGEDDLRAAGAAAGLRAEGLGHGGEALFKNATGLADHDGRQDDALSAKTRYTDFG